MGFAAGKIAGLLGRIEDGKIASQESMKPIELRTSGVMSLKLTPSNLS